MVLVSYRVVGLRPWSPEGFEIASYDWEKLMSILSMLIKTPDRNAEEWLLPRILKACYFVTLALGLIATLFYSVFFAKLCAYSMCETHLFRVLCTVFLTCCFCTIFLLLWIVACRLYYEVGILLFCIFQAQRDLVTEMKMFNDSVRKIAQTQLTSSQYNCDRLAEICDTLKGVDGNAAEDL